MAIQSYPVRSAAASSRPGRRGTDDQRGGQAGSHRQPPAIAASVAGLAGKSGRKVCPFCLRGCTSHVSDTPRIRRPPAACGPPPGSAGASAESGPSRRTATSYCKSCSRYRPWPAACSRVPGQEPSDPVAGIEVVLVERLPQSRERRFRDPALPGEHGQFGPALLVGGVKVVYGYLDRPQQGGVLVVVGELVRRPWGLGVRAACAAGPATPAGRGRGRRPRPSPPPVPGVPPVIAARRPRRAVAAVAGQPGTASSSRSLTRSQLPDRHLHPAELARERLGCGW